MQKNAYRRSLLGPLKGAGAVAHQAFKVDEQALEVGDSSQGLKPLLL